MKFTTLAVILAATFSTGVVYGPQVLAKAREIKDIYLNAELKRIEVREAGRTLLMNQNATVWRCHQVEMTDKLSLRRRK